jgi:hypothetical protein
MGLAQKLYFAIFFRMPFGLADKLYFAIFFRMSFALEWHYIFHHISECLWFSICIIFCHIFQNTFWFNIWITFCHIFENAFWFSIYIMFLSYFSECLLVCFRMGTIFLHSRYYCWCQVIKVLQKDERGWRICWVSFPF